MRENYVNLEFYFCLSPVLTVPVLEFVSSEDVDESTDETVDDVLFLYVLCLSSGTGFDIGIDTGTGTDTDAGSPVGVVSSDLEICTLFSNENELFGDVGVEVVFCDEICFVCPLICGIRDVKLPKESLLVFAVREPAVLVVGSGV